jgi:3-methyladenine DNA glycosylase AlkD
MKGEEVVSYLEGLSDPVIAKNSQRFFKTAKGEYGYGDIFLGIRVPVIREAVKKYKELKLSEVTKLLKSKYHEIRLFALLVLVYKFKNENVEGQEKIYNLYIKHRKYINNWDLVDSSAPYIVGAWLCNRDKTILYELAVSKRLWERRISILATSFFISKDHFNDTLKISSILLNDNEDLIHKAVGWMLREVGKKNRLVEEKYLRSRYKKMPRTMLRYAIEKFEPERRRGYLRGQI